MIRPALEKRECLRLECQNTWRAMPASPTQFCCRACEMDAQTPARQKAEKPGRRQTKTKAANAPAMLDEAKRLAEASEDLAGVREKMLNIKSLAELERDAILAALAKLNGHRLHTAKALGISKRQIFVLIEKFRAEGAVIPESKRIPISKRYLRTQGKK